MATSNNQPTSIHVVTLNCWGLKYISKQRRERLAEIGHQLAIANPPPQIVGLQECWTQEDYLEIRRLTSTILPYGKFYHAGFFGAGLAILSAWPIEESGMFAYPLNGRPAAFYRGDWFVGKGVASARVRVGSEMADIVEVFCTHLHAPYEAEHEDSYACHRTAQAWEIAKKMRHAAERGHTVLGLGDFNMLPGSLAHQIIEAHSPVRDVWLLSHPISKSTTQLTVQQALSENGSTCDSLYNTWRWSKQMQKDLGRGQANEVSLDTVDPDAKRLDYIFFASSRGAATQWHVEDVKVGMTQRHPTLETSLSDHFSVEATLVRSAADRQVPSMATPLSTATYDEILDMTAKYMLRERRQRSWRMLHFKTQLGVTVGCLVAVWWSPKNYVSFLLMLLSTIGLTAGVLDGLMGGLFVKGEIRALKEFQWEVENARKLASKS